MPEELNERSNNEFNKQSSYLIDKEKFFVKEYLNNKNIINNDLDINIKYIDTGAQSRIYNYQDYYFKFPRWPEINYIDESNIS